MVRRGAAGVSFGGGAADELPQRGALGVGAKAAVDDGLVDLVTGFRTDRIDLVDGQAALVAEDGRTLRPADAVVALTGFRPDLSFLGEMRLELDATLQAPVRIAAEVDPNLHSCGNVKATGAADLAHPEQDLYLGPSSSAPALLSPTVGLS